MGAKTLTITIDNQQVRARQGQTILQAARSAGIYIPSLCALEHLPSYGACRLCVVEVDGIRGYPTSCTTPVEEGMVIRTETAELRSLRQEVLKLLLSEHPASCLFCQEKSTCKEFMGTIRKVGMTTGCRYCPNDTSCELQTITEKVGLTETSYPVYFRNFTVEKFDPFYDRDYNLCILCGRCVRVCNEIRLNGTLSFKKRGKETTIGPAFERSHLDAGCEFCGACVSVCPTGALSVKTSKWYGSPENVVASTCSYCPAGCRLLMQVKKGEVIDVLPDYDSELDQGLLCVQGRFAIPEYVHSPARITKPQHLTPIGYEEIDWNVAVGDAAQRLAKVKPDDFLMVVSSQMSNEELFAAQKFTREAIGSDNIVPSALVDLGDDFWPFVDLVIGNSPRSAIENADVLVVVGFDSTYAFSPLGIAVKRAVQKGVPLIAIDERTTNLAMYADFSFTKASTGWEPIINSLMNGGSAKKKAGGSEGRVKGKGQTLKAANPVNIESILKKRNKVLIAGTGVLASPSRGAILMAILKLRESGSWKTITTHPYSNILGVLAMGALPGVKPGEFLKGGQSKRKNLPEKFFRYAELAKKRSVVYLVGETLNGALPKCDYLVYQNVLPGNVAKDADLVLPSCSFVETSGTLINSEGILLSLNKAIEPPGEAKPDWWIFEKIAQSLGKEKTGTYLKEMKRSVKGLPSPGKNVQFLKPGEYPAPKKKSDGLSGSRDLRQYSYRGIPLSDVVAGMAAIEEKKESLLKTGKERA